MSYSSGIYADDITTLEQSQFAKYDRICKALKFKTGMRVLEVGCGWGGFAEHAAQHYGVHVDGITISHEQLAYATDRIQRADLNPQVKLSYCDYRDVKGKYDRIVSIEMFEAVGEKYWPGYFKMIHDRLAPNGRAMIQTIVIADAKFAQYRKTSDFIREYIFPGGMLSSPQNFVKLANRAGLQANTPYYFGLNYAHTLRDWAHEVNKNEAPIKALGFDEKFLSIWRFYFHYCEAAFNSARTDVMQIELFKE
jgi:cyclopropane-fatty-acyl-phospholipid synthase